LHYKFEAKGIKQRVGCTTPLPVGWTKHNNLYKHDTLGTVNKRVKCFGASFPEIDVTYWTKKVQKYTLYQLTRKEGGGTKYVLVPGFNRREWAVVMKHLRDVIAKPAFSKYS
jgi:hypothetical protein